MTRGDYLALGAGLFLAGVGLGWRLAEWHGPTRRVEVHHDWVTPVGVDTLWIEYDFVMDSACQVRAERGTR